MWCMTVEGNCAEGTFRSVRVDLFIFSSPSARRVAVFHFSAENIFHDFPPKMISKMPADTYKIWLIFQTYHANALGFFFFKILFNF